MNYYKIPGLFMLLFSFIYNAKGQTVVSPHWEQQNHYKQFNFSSEKQYDNLHPSPPASFKPHSKKANCNLQYDVYGWHPFWMGTAYNNYDFNLLSTFSYFSYELNPSTGSYNTIHSWKTTNAINLAQNAGCRVELCVTNFGYNNNQTFLNNSTARQTLIDSLISLIKYRNADGVNIDFEQIYGSDRDSLTSFMTQLSSQLKSQVPGATVSIALFSVDWNNVFDITALDQVVDKFIIMGYGYYYSGSSTAGPTSPLYSGQLWSSYNLTRSVNYYLDQGVTPSKLCAGLPYYGYEWETTSGTIPSSTTGNFSSSRTYSYIRNNTSGNYSNKQFDEHSYVPYYVYQTSGNLRQAFVDDAYSLGRKLDMIKQKGIGGMGIWALGYDNGYNALWNMIEDKFTDCATTPCTDSLFDMGGPHGKHYNNESYSYTIAPDNASKVKLNFTSFSLESGYDSLWIYDGTTTSDPVIGSFSGTTVPGQVTSSGPALTLEFYSDGATIKNGWKAYYYCEKDTVPPTTSVSTNYNWHTADFTANFNDADSGGSGLEKRYYQVIDYNGTEWRGNHRNGFFSDNFNTSIHSDWTISTGTWAINSGVLEQSNETIGNSNIYAKLDQTLSNRYLYHWRGNISGSGTNKRAGLHFFCDDASQTNRGNSYFAWFREDDDKVQFYKVTGNIFSLMKEVPYTINPNQWYDYKVIFDRITGKITIYIDNKLVDSWTDTSPHTAGNYISFRNGNSNYKVNNFKVYRSRYPSVTVTVGADTTNDIRYQNPNPTTPSAKVKSIVADSAGNLSSIGFKMINVDWSAPSSVSTNDGTGSDIDTTNNNTQLSANWSTSTDQHSGIGKYWYAIGDSPGDTNIVGWTNNAGNTSVTHSGLSLTYGNTYYFTVKTENGAGLYAKPDTSDGQILLMPTAIKNSIAKAGNLNIYPNPFRDKINIEYISTEKKTITTQVYNIEGKLIQSRQVKIQKGKNNFNMDTSGLPKGTYIIKPDLNSPVIKKIIKN